MAKTTQYDIKLKEEVTSQLRTIDTKFKDLNSSMKNIETSGNSAFNFLKGGVIAGAFSVAGSAITSFVGDSLKAFADYEESLLKLQAQLNVSGSNLGVTFQQIKTLANDLEGATGIDDAEYLKGISLMQTFQNVRGKVFEEAIKQSGNLSVIFGDIGTSATQLGKALDDPINGLDKLAKANIRFSDTEKEHLKNLVATGNLEEAQMEILDKVKTKFDGVAETLNIGVNGSLRNFGNTFDDAMKRMGASVATYAQPAIDYLTKVLNNMGAESTLGAITKDQKKQITELQSFVSGLSNVRTPEAKNKLENIIADKIKALESQGLSLADLVQATATAKKDWEETVKKESLGLDKASIPFLDSSKKVKELEAFEAQLRQIKSTYDTLNGNSAQKAQQEANADAQAKLKASLATTAKTLIVSNDSTYTAIQDILDEKNAIRLQKEKKTADAIVTIDDELLEKRRAKFLQSFLPKNTSAPQGLFTADQMTQLQQIQDYLNPITNQATSLMATLSTIQNNETQAKIDNMTREFNEWYSLESQKIAIKKQNGEDTTNDEIVLAGLKAQKQLEIDTAERESKRKGFEQAKMASMASTAMALAQAEISALTAIPFGPWNFVQAGIVGALGLTNLGLIASQANPYMSGGIVPGISTSGDTSLARLNSGEMVLNKSQQANLYNLAKYGSSGDSAPIVYFYLMDKDGNETQVSRDFVTKFWNVDKLMKRDFAGQS